MTAQALPRHRHRRRSRSLLPAIIAFAALAAAGITFVSYVLWPTWSKTSVALEAPSVPVTVAGVLFNVPPTAIRAPIQRHAGAHERLDLVFLWPSLTPPAAGAEPAIEDGGAVPAPRTGDRLFVTIAALGAVLAPLERLHTIYPRYAEAQAKSGPQGLGILPFRAGTPYEGEDLVYYVDKPELFFVLCSRPANMVPGTCIDEVLVDTAEITLRFPRDWLIGWRDVAAGFERLTKQINPPRH